jgi:NADH-quinone oxidoreductase subunit E
MMMVKAGKQDDKKEVADEAASFSGLAESSAKLFAEQAAAMTVFTAYGMSVAAQMTGMMLGALRGPAQASETKEPEAKPQAEAKGNVVPLRPVETVTPEATVKASVAKARVVKVPARKAPTVKPVASKAESTPVAPAVAVPKAMASETGDDLKKIPGIGPRLEKVLNDRGIVRYSDISGLSRAALRKLDAELGLEGRVIRDDWAGQAKALSGGKG